MDDLANSALRDRWHSRPRRCARWVVGSEHTPATGLPRNGCSHSVCVTLRGGCCLSAISTLASVDITDQDSTVAINRDIEEIEQVANDVGSATP